MLIGERPTCLSDDSINSIELDDMGFVLYLRKTISIFFEYDTPRYVHINSKKIGIFSRLIQLIILGYIIGYVLVYKKGYQDSSPVESTVVTKVKGVLYTNYTDEELGVPNHPELYRRIWDPSDYVVPASGLEHGGFFVMTNVVVTPNQTRGTCAEDTKIIPAVCETDSNCRAGRALEVGNGVQTGKCVRSERLGSRIKTCEIIGWCPVEQDILPLNGSKALLDDARNSTVLIKNGIAFPMFGKQYKRRNILEDSNSTYLQECTYHRETDPYCPVFRIGSIVEDAGENFTEVAIRGGVFVIQISWVCDLDINFMEYCNPSYSFSRMDNPNAQIAPGWNFRSAEFHEQGRRTLFKMYGIKFLIEVEGEAGKFNVIPLLLNIGSGLALMGLATIICDYMVLHWLKSGKVVKEKKYKNVRGHDAYDINPNSSRPTPTSESQTRRNKYSRFDSENAPGSENEVFAGPAGQVPVS